jgi:hypothetical protein
MDEVLYSIADDVKNFGVIYLVDITEVSDFNSMCAIHSLFDTVLASLPFESMVLKLRSTLSCPSLTPPGMSCTTRAPSCFSFATSTS